MLWTRRTTWIAVGLLAGLTGISGTLGADPARNKFYQAFYVEQSGGDLESAADLYTQILADPAADAELKTQAKDRLAGCREELACRDFAHLMPPNALVYIELNQPGDRLRTLLGQLGLMANGKPSWPPGTRRVAVSPILINETLGLGGAALAITGFDPAKEIPSGVLIVHPGSVEVIRGLIETLLPTGAALTQPIQGYATYDVEGKVFVTLTSRLVIVSPNRAEIEGVLRRLAGEERNSLATNSRLTEVMKDRSDALLFFNVDAQPVVSMVTAMAAAGGPNREFAMAQALLDLNSLRSLSGKLDVGEDAIVLDVSLRLDGQHRNLLYNFVRTPPIRRDTLRCIPSGAAGFLAGALNESAPPLKTSAAPASPVVTALDLGREVFGNITSFALYALPPGAYAAASAPAGPIPDVALVMTVNDPAASNALWAQALGIASLAAGATALEGTPIELDGVSARSFHFPENVTVFLAGAGQDVFVSTSRLAIARSLQAKRGGPSILDDPIFARSLSQLTNATTKALVVHPGRCVSIARPFMSQRDAAEMEPVTAVLSDTVVSAMVAHSGEQLRISATVAGIPDVGDLVGRLLQEEWRRKETRSALSKAMGGKDWDKALQIVSGGLAEQPGDLDLLKSKFKILAVGKENR